MISFDFITDEAFKRSLVSDWAELKSCLEAKAWKSAHVMAGSIVEAVLIDYLLFSRSKTKAKDDPLKMDLTTAISACQREGAVSEKTAHLCSAIKDYRNLIHPGRSIRLGEAIDENSARVADALVGMVVAEVSSKKKETYGYTAEQLLAKLESDPSARHLLRHLMEGMHEAELERLLLVAIPKRHAELSEDRKAHQDLLETLERCFHHTFGIANEQTKQKTARKLVSIIKEETGDTVLWYETAFFAAGQLAYLSASDAKLVKRHILGRPRVQETEACFRLIQGLEGYITVEEAALFISALSYLAFGSTDLELKTRAASYLAKPPSKMSHESKAAAAQKMHEIAKFFREQKLNDEAQNFEEYAKMWDAAVALEGLTDALKQLASRD